MPGIPFHVSRSISPPNIAKLIHERLDYPEGIGEFDINLHLKWRKLTHNDLTAAFIGFSIGHSWEGVYDAIRHVYDDLLYNKLFYGSNSQFRQDEAGEYEGKEEE